MIQFLSTEKGREKRGLADSRGLASEGAAGRTRAARRRAKEPILFDRWLVFTSDGVGVVSGVISAKESESEESERFLFFSDSAYDSIAYDLVKTKLSESEAEAEG